MLVAPLADGKGSRRSESGMTELYVGCVDAPLNQRPPNERAFFKGRQEFQDAKRSRRQDARRVR